LSFVAHSWNAGFVRISTASGRKGYVRHGLISARSLTGAAREGLWQKALNFWPPYADYAKKTEREIPVVLLDPIAS
jgi:hypothetical protein